MGMSVRQKQQNLVLGPCSRLRVFGLVVVACFSSCSSGAACLSLLGHGAKASVPLSSGAAVCISMSAEGVKTYLLL